MIIAGLRTGYFYGNIMNLLTAECFSAFAVTIRNSRIIEMLHAVLILGAVLSLVSLILLGENLNILFPDLLRSILLGSFISEVPNTFFITASQHLVATKLTLFMLLEFALGRFWVWIFIKKAPAQTTLIDGGLFIIAVLLSFWFKMRQNITPLSTTILKIPIA